MEGGGRELPEGCGARRHPQWGPSSYGSCSASFSVSKMLPAASDVGHNLQQVCELCWGQGSARAAEVPGSPSREFDSDLRNCQRRPAKTAIRSGNPDFARMLRVDVKSFSRGRIVINSLLTETSSFMCQFTNLQ